MICCLSRALQLASEYQKGDGVPKIIHQTWKTEQVPDAWAPSSASWTNLHPDWTYILWTDDDIDVYIKSKWPDDYDMFKNLPYAIQRVDLWRYYVLRDFGGLYSDLDIMPITSINSYVSNQSIQLVPSANESSVFTNALMISGNDQVSKTFWTLLIEEVKDYAKSHTLSVTSAASRHMEIMESTGPLALTRAARNFTMPISILPSKVWNPYDLSLADMPDEQTSKHAIIKILPGSSWHSADSSVISFALVYKGPIITFFVLLILFYIVKSEILKTKFAFLRRRKNGHSV